MGVEATWAERGCQKTSVACTDRILSRVGVRVSRERSPILCAGGHRSSPALAQTCGQHRSAVRWSCAEPLGRKHSPRCGECFCQAAWAAIEARGSRAAHKIAHIVRERLNVLFTGLTLLCVCNTPNRREFRNVSYNSYMTIYKVQSRDSRAEECAHILRSIYLYSTSLYLVSTTTLVFS